MKNTHRNNNMKIYEGLKLGKGARRDPVCPQTTSELIRYINSLDNDDFIDVGNVDISNLTSLSWMFQDCTNLISVNASSWRTGKVTSMVRVFQNCQKLKTLDVTDWDVSKVETMHYLFFQCYELETIIGLDTWDTKSLVDMASVFARCHKIKSLSDIEL